MRRTAEAAAETRRAIFDAALWTFAEKGWAATTLDEVARQSGVTRGAVYHHARDKADLLISVLAGNWATAMVPAWNRLSTDGESPVERLAGFLAEFLRLLNEDDRFRALAIVTVDVAPRIPMHAADTTEKQDVLATWRSALRGVVIEIGDPLPSGLSPDEVVNALMAVLYGATSLSSSATSPGCAPGPAVAKSIVHGLIEGACNTR